jgi:gamma-glutamylcyclotransferase
MDPARLRAREIDPLSCRRSILDGFSLKFNKMSTANPLEGKANIVESPGSRVEGILWEIADFELKRLDRCEGVSTHDYVHSSVTVKLDDESRVAATTYVAHPAKIRPNLKPTKQYMTFLLAGAPFLSVEYVLGLRAVETLD